MFYMQYDAVCNRTPSTSLSVTRGSLQEARPDLRWAAQVRSGACSVDLGASSYHVGLFIAAGRFHLRHVSC